MLVLARKKGETIQIGGGIEIKIIDVTGETVRVGIEAPRSVDILRGELVQLVTETNTEATTVPLDLFNQLKKDDTK